MHSQTAGDSHQTVHSQTAAEGQQTVHSHTAGDNQQTVHSQTAGDSQQTAHTQTADNNNNNDKVLHCLRRGLSCGWCSRPADTNVNLLLFSFFKNEVHSYTLYSIESVSFCFVCLFVCFFLSLVQLFSN